MRLSSLGDLIGRLNKDFAISISFIVEIKIVFNALCVIIEYREGKRFTSNF